MKYKKKKADLFIREDSGGTNIILNRKEGKQLYLNSTGLEIFKSIELFNESSHLSKYIFDKYSDVKLEEIEQDVIDILSILEIYDLIKIDRVNTVETKNNNYTMKFIGDRNYYNASKFILENINQSNFNIQPTVSKEYYSPFNMRMNTMNNNEYYIQILDSNEIVSVISIHPPNYTDRKNYLLISSFYISETVENKSKEIYREIFEFLINQFKNINKIRINVLRDEINPQLPLWLPIFKELGFEKECELIKEIENKDLLMYTKFTNQMRTNSISI